MSDRSAIAYLYDGTFEGLLCCVFESFRAKESPAAIYSPDTFAGSLYPVRQIETEPDKARRVHESIPRKISPQALELVRLCFLTRELERECMILAFLRLGFRCGAQVCDMLQEDAVCALHAAVRHLRNEAHYMLEFLRFNEYDGALAAVIEPKNVVLPLIVEHYCSRFPDETFLIYDKTHKMGLFYRPYEARILPIEQFELPRAGEEERAYRRLWRQYYASTAIEGRLNPKCRMTHCPKRYWGHMTEFMPDEPAGADAPALVFARRDRLPPPDKRL